MGLTGEKIKGKESAKSGVATNYVTREKLEKLKTAIIEKPTEDTALKNVQNIVSEFAEITYSTENFSFPRSEEIQRTFIVDSLEEVYQRLNNLIEKGSEDEKQWAQNILKIFEKSSP